MTYLCRLSTLVLKVQPYLIVLIWPHLGYFLHILVLLGLFFGLGWGPKRFLTPINVDYQFWFWNYSPIFFFHSAQFGVFLDLFGPFGAIFGVGFRSKNFLTTFIHSLTAFAKLSPSFSFSWAELVFILNFHHPPTPGKVSKWPNIDNFIKTKLIMFACQPHIVNRINLFYYKQH